MERLEEWAKKWQIEYNVGKCEVMHFARKNRGIDYYLLKSEGQRGLGVLIQESLQVNMQVQLTVRKADATLAFILRRLEYKNKDVLLRLYKALMGLHLEYCEQFWALYLRKDVKEGGPEEVSQVFLRMRDLSYEEWFRTLGLYSTELRRRRGDTLGTYRILRGLDRVDVEKIFPI
eukprot:g28144.t1